MTQRKKISNTVLYGGIASLVMILFTIGTWRAGTTVFIGPVAYAMYAIPVIFAIVAAAMDKRRQGYLDFRPALKASFGVIVLSLVTQRIFTWILVHWIDPAFGRSLGPAVLANTEAAYRRFGMPEDQIRENIEAAKGSDAFGLGSMAWGLAISFVPLFLVALLIAAAVKSKKPAEGTA